ncbi:MAG: hypothetical protein IT370_35920 [Deltaproteobacteria bacterium]|nr:hypothetical protein [Deltaproteobacteria bacterium]
MTRIYVSRSAGRQRAVQRWRSAFGELWLSRAGRQDVVERGETQAAQHQVAGFRFALLDPAQLVLDERGLADDERALLASRQLSPSQRERWIRGRAALRWLAPELGSVLEHRDGAPRPVNPAWAVSLSHAGEHVAVVVMPRRDEGTAVAIDLVPMSASAMLVQVLAGLRLAVHGELSPPRVWAALECALKLRRSPVDVLLSGQLRVSANDNGDGAVVHGVGRPAEVRFLDRARHLLGVACEP